MKKLLLFIFAPFQLAGGMLIGYTGYQIRMETTTYMDPFFIAGVALVVVGWFFRRMVFKSILKQNDLRGEQVDQLEEKVGKQDEVLSVIKESVLEKVDVVNGEVVKKPSKEIVAVKSDKSDKSNKK
jgi:hypothetical protein